MMCRKNKKLIFLLTLLTLSCQVSAAMWGNLGVWFEKICPPVRSDSVYNYVYEQKKEFIQKLNEEFAPPAEPIEISQQFLFFKRMNYFKAIAVHNNYTVKPQGTHIVLDPENILFSTAAVAAAGFGLYKYLYRP